MRACGCVEKVLFDMKRTNLEEWGMGQEGPVGEACHMDGEQCARVYERCCVGWGGHIVWCCRVQEVERHPS